MPLKEKLLNKLFQKGLPGNFTIIRRYLREIGEYAEE
jgi:hypothetical protein